MGLTQSSTAPLNAVGVSADASDGRLFHNLMAEGKKECMWVCSGIMGNFEHIYLVGPWRCPSKHRFVCPNWAPPHLPTSISAHTLEPSRALLVTAKFAYTAHWLYALLG